MSTPRVLALDTATEQCSVALAIGHHVECRREDVGQRHSARVLPMIDALLTGQGVALQDLDVIAFGAGPGSFTGLRIACGIAQGLAWSAGKRLIPVGNLQALAARVMVRDPEVGTVLCAIDARMHEAYCALYRRAEVPEELVAPALATAADLAALAVSADAVAGNALAAFASAWPAARDQRRYPDEAADAGDIARLATHAAVRAAAVPPERAAPLYVRNHVALTIEERRSRSLST
jgi:tRNA threonylcarbamoyladenosine biosynthesis protein TsaB